MSDAANASEQLKALLAGTRILALGVLVADRPYVGQVPFATWRRRGSLLIHVSALARHSRGLDDGARWSGLVSAARGPRADVDGAAEDPFRVPRVSLEGEVSRLRPTSREYAEAKEVYLDRLPSGAGHFALGDFSLIELGVTKGRLVAGFGSTFNLTAAHLREL